MDGDVVAGAGGEPHGAGLFVGHGVAPGGDEAFHRPVRHARGDLVVEHVDHAADGAAAIQQGGRAAQHFHFARQHGFHGGGVVRRNRRHIEQLRAVGQHADTRRGLAADHRPAGAAAVGVGVHAGQAIQGIAQGGFALLEQQLVFKQVERGRRQIGVAAQRQGGHFHGVQPAVGVGGRGLGGRRHGPDHGGHGGGRHGGRKAFHVVS